MTCDERRDLLLLYATDGLEPAEADELRVHLASGCPQCAGALAEAQATVAHLPLALEPIPAPAQVKEKLMKRIATESAEQPMRLAEQPSASVRASGWRLFTTGAVAAALAAILTASGMFYRMQEQKRMIAGEEFRVVSLDRAEAQPKAHGRVFWDQKNHTWLVYVFDMTPPPPGREYELWFVPQGQKPVRGPTFTVDGSGKAQLRVPMPPDMAPLAAAAITDEPMGGLDQPSGNYQLLGQIK